MVEIGERPILWHIMKIYAQFGVRRFILALGHLGERVIEYFEDYNAKHTDSTLRFGPDGVSPPRYHSVVPETDISDWEITFAHTGIPTMTGGRLARVRQYIDQETFFCTYGDGVSDVDIRSVYAQHRRREAVGTLVGVHPPATFGIIEADAKGTIQSFLEKPVLPGFVNGGFFCFTQEIFDFIEGDSTVLESDSLSRVAHQGKLDMFPHEGFWHAMDHYKDYITLNQMWSKGRAPWKVW